ncbi:MAG: lipopolysaccharide biosynthesis protein [Phycisphaerales bacterium]|nr:lipopolysaccharide biosynthesis protein [Phycisphaerales bacterium]
MAAIMTAVDDDNPQTSHAPESAVRPAESATAPQRQQDPTAPSGVLRSTGLASSMGTYLTANVAIRLLNLARVLVLTRIMLKPQYGLLSSILIVTNVLTPLCSLGLNEAIARYVPQYENTGSLARFARRSLTLLVIVTVIAVAGILANANWLGEWFYATILEDPATRAAFASEAPSLARVTGLIIALSAIYFYLMAVMKGLRMFQALSWLELVHSVLFLGGCMIVAVTQQLSAFTIASLYAASLAIPCVWFGFRLLPALVGWQSQQGDERIEGLEKKLFRFSIWTTLAGVTWQALINYPAWHLKKIHGDDAMAVFFGARQICNIVFVGAVAISTVVMATITRTWETEGREAAEKQLSLAFRTVGLGLLLLCALISLTKTWVIQLLRADYAAGAEIMPLHLLFFLLGAYLAFLPAHFHLRERTRQMLWPWIAGVGINVLLAIFLVGPRLGVVQNSSWGRTIDGILNTIFVTGIIDPTGLGPAAWCGVFGMTAAVGVCVLLVSREHYKLDRGSVIVLLSAFVVAGRPWLVATSCLVLVAISLRGSLVFTPDERRKVMRYIAAVPTHVPAVRKLIPGVWRDHG